MDIELRLLKAALALAEHGNFARAAKAIHLSQPSLSRNIQELESRLGVQLFLRDRTGVQATAAGTVLLEQAAEVMSRTADLVREMELLRGLQKGELSVGAGVYPGPMFVDRAVARLVSEYPATQIALQYANATELMSRLLKRELDLAIIYMAPGRIDPQLSVTKLKPHPTYFVVRDGHPLLQSRGVPAMADILRYPLTTTAAAPIGLRRRLLGAATKQAPINAQTLRSVPSVGCESLSMMKTVVLHSDAVGLLPLNVVLAEIKLGTLAVLPFVEPWLQIQAGIVRLEHRSLSPLGEHFVQFVREADADLTKLEQKNAGMIFNRRRQRRTRSGSLSA